MEITEEAHFNENALNYCSKQWEQQLLQFSKQHSILENPKIRRGGDYKVKGRPSGRRECQQFAIMYRYFGF